MCTSGLDSSAVAHSDPCLTPYPSISLLPISPRCVLSDLPSVDIVCVAFDGPPSVLAWVANTTNSGSDDFYNICCIDFLIPAMLVPPQSAMLTSTVPTALIPTMSTTSSSMMATTPFSTLLTMSALLMSIIRAIGTGNVTLASWCVLRTVQSQFEDILTTQIIGEATRLLRNGQHVSLLSAHTLSSTKGRSLYTLQSSSDQSAPKYVHSSCIIRSQFQVNPSLRSPSSIYLYLSCLPTLSLIRIFLSPWSTLV